MVDHHSQRALDGKMRERPVMAHEFGVVLTGPEPLGRLASAAPIKSLHCRQISRAVGCDFPEHSTEKMLKAYIVNLDDPGHFSAHAPDRRMMRRAVPYVIHVH